MLAKHTTDSWIILSRILSSFLNLKDDQLSRTLIYVVSTTLRAILEYSGNAMGFRYRNQFAKVLRAVSLGLWEFGSQGAFGKECQSQCHGTPISRAFNPTTKI